MKLFLAFLVFLGITCATIAEQRLPLIQPLNNGLVIAKVERDNGLFAKFKGNTWITGTLTAQWQRGVDETADNTLNVRLIPNQRSIKALPHFKNYPIEKLELDNEQETLRLTFTKDVLAQFEIKKITHIEAKGSFLIADYVVGIDCDSPYAGAKVIRVRIPKQPHSASFKPQTGCN